MNMFEGTGVALVTPFQEDLTIDFLGLEKLINFVTTGGADYLVVMGTTGESPTLSKSEKTAVLEKVIAINQGKLPIVYGIGGNSTQAVIEEIKATNLEGVSAILSVSPFYNKPTQEGIIAHFQSIADESPLPIILYNIPGRTMSNLEAETTLTLAQHPNIIGIKEASGNMAQCEAIASQKPDGFLLISGDDIGTLEMNEMGGSGIISVLANGIPEVFEKLAKGNSAEKQEAQDRILDLNSLMYEESNPVGIKNLLKHLGICGDQVRMPLLRASENLNDRIKAKL